MTSPLFLLARIDFPDFGSFSETRSEFWKLRFLKNPRQQRGHHMAFRSLAFETRLMLNRLAIERQMHKAREAETADNRDGQQRAEEEQEVGAKLERVDDRLNRLRPKM
jgi:hypothetical protein